MNSVTHDHVAHNPSKLCISTTMVVNKVVMSWTTPSGYTSIPTSLGGCSSKFSSSFYFFGSEV